MIALLGSAIVIYFVTDSPNRNAISHTVIGSRFFSLVSCTEYTKLQIILHIHNSLTLENMNLNKHKPTIQLLAAILLIFVGCGLLITGFIIPPPGEIHNSVLIAFGEILTFAGALFGIDYHYKYKNHEKD